MDAYDEAAFVRACKIRKLRVADDVQEVGL
jgi:hypothetical protein